WHTDMETARAPGRTVSVWIGLQHTTRACALLVLPHSHHFEATAQEVRNRLRDDPGGPTDERLFQWAHERDSRCQVVRPEMSDGQALFCDGALWHGTHNLTDESRRAVLLQYATPDVAIRIPDANTPAWPYRLLDTPRPPCLMLRGS